MPDVTATNFGSGLTHNNYLKDTNGPAGISNGKLMTFSGWIKPTEGEGKFLNVGSACVAKSDGSLSLKFPDTIHTMPAVNCFQFRSALGLLQYGTPQWYHLMFSFDLDDNNKRHVYLDGVEIGSGGSFNQYTPTNMKLAQEWNVGGKNKEWPGCLSEFWIDDSYIDLSDPGERGKFYRLGEAVYCGTDGSLPTGVQPLYYLPLDASDPGKNLGNGGDMTVNGTLSTACSDAPTRFGSQVVALPALESGSTQWWLQQFASAVLPEDLDKVHDMYGVNPGVINQSNHPAGDPRTFYSSAQDKLVLATDHTELGYDNNGGTKRNHTEIEPHSTTYFTWPDDPTDGKHGRVIHCDTNAVKWSAVIAWDGDVTISNPKWAILWQAKDTHGDMGNPVLSLVMTDGVVKLWVRAKIGGVQEDEDYVMWDMTDPGMEAGTFHTLEIWWKLGVADDAYWRVDLDGETLGSSSTANLGVEDLLDDGVLMTHGVYHNYDSLSNWTEAYAYFSDIRIEQTTIT